MDKYAIILIDEDPDEHVIMGSVLPDLPLIESYQYYPNAGKLITLLATGVVAAPDYVLLGTSFPTAETALIVSNLRSALACSTCEVVLYGIYNGFIQPFLEAHSLRFLHKSPSFEELHQQLASLLNGRHEIKPMDRQQSDDEVPFF